LLNNSHISVKFFIVNDDEFNEDSAKIEATKIKEKEVDDTNKIAIITKYIYKFNFGLKKSRTLIFFDNISFFNIERLLKSDNFSFIFFPI
jgi:hypothetical protein